MILNVVDLSVRLVCQVHPGEVLVFAEDDREGGLHPAPGEQAVLDGALALEEVAQLGRTDAKTELRDWPGGGGRESVEISRECERKGPMNRAITCPVDSLLQFRHDVFESSDGQKEQRLERAELERRRLILGGHAAGHLEVPHHLDDGVGHQLGLVRVADRVVPVAPDQDDAVVCDDGAHDRRTQD